MKKQFNKLIVLAIFTFTFGSIPYSEATENVIKSQIIVPKYNWDSIANSSQKVWDEKFWRSSPDNYYWIDNIHDKATFNHYWQTAHAIEALMDAYERTHDDFYKIRARTVLARIKQSHPNRYHTNFYDDMAWLGIACIRAYKIFGEEVYLKAAEFLLEDVKQGWVEDAGMKWKNDTSTGAEDRNACTNWTVSCFAVRMYLLKKDQEDLSFSQKVYLWSKKNLYDEATGGTLSKPFNLSSSKIFVTYNQGVLIGSSLSLYEATGQKTYLYKAIRCADFCIENDKFAKEGIWRDEGATGTLNQNNGIFKGILIHYMVDLIRCKDLPEVKRKVYIQFIEQMAITLYNATKRNLLFPGDWRREAYVGERIYLGCQMSGVILLESINIFFREYPALLKNVTKKQDIGGARS